MKWRVNRVTSHFKTLLKPNFSQYTLRIDLMFKMTATDFHTALGFCSNGHHIFWVQTKNFEFMRKMQKILTQNFEYRQFWFWTQHFEFRQIISNSEFLVRKLWLRILRPDNFELKLIILSSDKIPKLNVKDWDQAKKSSNSKFIF